MYYIYMNFQVPQNIDVPDTIIFGLSFRQLVYLSGAVGFFIFFFFLTGSFVLALIFASPIIFLAGLLSFFSLNKQPFSVILQSAIGFFRSKKMYVWKKEDVDSYVKRKLGNQGDKKGSVVSEKSRVNDLSTSLIFDDTVIDTTDVDI